MDKNKREKEKYRKCVGIMLLNKDGKVFVGRRADTKDIAWQMPQGGIEQGEPLREAAKRELVEEIGTDAFELIFESDKEYYYDIPQEICDRLWHGRYVGQVQKWLVAKFLGQDSDINIQTQTPEFIEWKWQDFSSLPNLIVDFKKDLYQELVSDFAPIIDAIKSL